MDYSTSFLIFGDKNHRSVLGQFNESIRVEISKSQQVSILDLNTFDSNEAAYFEYIASPGFQLTNTGLIQVGNNQYSGWNLLASRQGCYSLLIHDLYVWDSWYARLVSDSMLQKFSFLDTRVLKSEDAADWISKTGWPITENTVNAVELLVRLIILANGIVTHSSWAQSRLMDLQRLIPSQFNCDCRIVSIRLPFFAPNYFEDSHKLTKPEIQQLRDFRGLIFTSLGSHDDNRGLLESIVALKRLDTANVLLIIAGRVDPLLYKAALAAKGALRIIFLGPVTDIEYQEVLEKTSIFVNLRKFPFEAASGTLVDSLRTGKPTIINNSGCRMDYLGLPNAIVVQDLSPRSLAEAFLNAVTLLHSSPTISLLTQEAFHNLNSYALEVARACRTFSKEAKLENYTNNRLSLTLGYNF